MTLAELEDYCEAELDEPRRRAAHVWTHMYGDNFLSRSLGGEEEGNGNDGENREFSGRFLDKMSERGVDVGAGLSLASSRTASDGTKKLVFRRDSEGGVGEVETVLIPVQGEGRKSRVTVCVSSQVGCAMGCKFCFTGLMGLEANLTAGEIVEQVVEAKRAQKGTPLPVTNIVYMGMGEPFDNYDEVVKSIRILTQGGKGYTAFSERKITVSTVGLVPEMRRFVAETDAQLAVSLHATTESQRQSIVPQNSKHGLHEIVGALEELFPLGMTSGSHGRHVLIEYVMLRGVNDAEEDAERLAGLLAHVECKVNLIVFNTFEGAPFGPSNVEEVRAFRAILVKSGLVCTVRDSRGDDKMAACGQLGLGKRRRKKV
mmetsp:Transcript_6068/g.21713  ORF Transcript_6068/g.21713 Transcript_6068/m.21713 type:complete len:372 (+) Transcript_6068:243-1358(+)